MPKKVIEENKKVEIPIRQEPDINQIIIESYLMLKEIIEYIHKED